MKASIYSAMAMGGLIAALAPGVSAQAQTKHAAPATSHTVRAQAPCHHHQRKLVLPKKKPKGVDVWGYFHSYSDDYGNSCGRNYVWLKITDTANDSKKAYVKIKDESCLEDCHTYYTEKRAPGGKGKSATFKYYPIGYKGSFKGCVDNDSWGTKAKCSAYKVMYSYH